MSTPPTSPNRDPVYVALLAVADKIDSDAAALLERNKSPISQTIVGAMQGAAAIVRAEAWDRLRELATP